MREKYDNGFQIRENQTTHHSIKAISQDLLVLDAQYQHADAAFQQGDVRKEKDLR